MARQLFTNNASALLAASIDDVETVIQVTSGFGALFPDPGAGEWFIVTLENANGDLEICRCTGRISDLLTVVRGQEGTVAQAWVNGLTRVEGRVTAGTLDEFIQRSGGTMAGDLDMDGNELVDAAISGGSLADADEIVNTPIRGASGAVGNQITVPVNGTSRAQAGGENIVVASDIEAEDITALAFVIGQIILWYGAEGAIPDGWQRCDGTNGTPDLRDRMVMGAGSTYAFDSQGGAASVNSGAGGSHTPVIQETVLAEDQIPAHNHRLYVFTGGHSSDVDGFSGSGDAESLAGQRSGPHAYAENGQAGNQLVENAGGGGGGGHTHDADVVPDHTHTVAVLPPYKALHYIMFVGF